MITEERTTHFQEEEVPVKIYLNNGMIRYGIVINNDTNTASEIVNFISSEKIKSYQVTKDNCLVEAIFSTAIASIDTYLK